MQSPCNYRLPENGADLEQGDILEPTTRLRSILRGVHPHFCDPKYLGFMVLTQTCDLVRRTQGGSCTSRYVTIATIRSLSDCLEGLLGRVCKQLDDGIYDRDSKLDAKRFLQRLVNQNEQKRGLFYLYPDAEAIGIADHAVVTLQVSIALRAKEHYSDLVGARRGGLEPPFQTKLGWLVGNLFSRVATPDWSRKELEKLIKKLLRDCAPDAKWLSKDEFDAAVAGGLNLTGLSESEAKQKLNPHLPKPPREKVVDEVMQVTEQVFGEAGVEENLKKLRHRLSNNPVISSLVK